MDSIEEAVEHISREDLENTEFCYFCLAFGISIEDALHNSDIMDSGPITSDSKCPHCYDTEEESGRLRLTKQEKNLADAIIKEFNKYKEQRLNKEYNS
jgi:hypothetical protein